MFLFFLTIYFLTIFLCFCTYALYPLTIWILNLFISFKVKKREIAPIVSIVIPAYNEAKDIERKINNTLVLDYPKEKMEILVGSDGSTDKTAEIVRKFINRNVQLIEFGENRGKTAVQNDLVNRSRGEILIFTDAASFLDKDAIRKLVKNFADQRVGCVAGSMIFANIDSNITTQSQGLYWRYESKIRQLESNLGRLIGVDGPLYAMRRDCYIHLAGNIISDLIMPLLVLKQKKRVVLEPKAFVYEDPTHKSRQELNTRRRITLRGLVSLLAHIEILHPLRYPLLAAQIFFHKILRWFVGPLVIVNIIACLSLSSNKVFIMIMVLYILFGIAAIIGWVLDHFGKPNRLLRVPYYFSLVNLAATLGIIDFFRKKQAIVWKPTRHI
jgi:cellulose synthase/poly-beta-1,6-N-acetylglucosamine synthase-like glycosyltransferase